MSGFVTKLPYDNRQLIQYIDTDTFLSGSTTFGTDFSGLTSGVDLNTVITTSTLTGVTSTFSGNTEECNIIFGDPRMVSAINSLEPITNLNSGSTQTAIGYQGNDFVEIDGNIVYTSYTGSTYDFSVVSIEEVDVDTWTGVTYTNNTLFLSGSSLDYQERLIWVDVKGITQTKQMILTDEPEVDNTNTSVLTRNSEGDIVQRQTTYIHDQGIPSATWNVQHNLGKFPSITVIDSAGTVVVGAVDYIDNNNIIITFNSSFSGKAICN